MITNTFKKIKSFDAVTQFRLINAFIFAVGINMLEPVLMDLKGEYLAAWIISMFMIGEQLVVKTNRYLVNNFSLSALYRTGIYIHILLVGCASLYFYNPIYMIVLDSILSILSIGIFGAYTIKLNNYLTDNYPKDMSEFQIIRNSTWSDGLLIGLFITTVINYFYSIDISLICFMIYNSCFIVWMLANWNFYSSKDI